jgi:hypothetical protein
MLLDLGFVSEDELADPDGPVGMPPMPEGFAPPTAEQILATVDRDVSERVETDVRPRFSIGDAVIARNEHPRGHTRMPRYVRGHAGTVVTLHGVHNFQDELPEGLEIGPQHLYTVAFDAQELWGARGHPKDTIHVELWEYHLDTP